MLTVVGIVMATDFDLTFTLFGSDSSATGTTQIALPYSATGLSTASNLLADVGPSADCILRFDPTTDTWERFAEAGEGESAGCDNPFITAGSDFNLAAGEGYRVIVLGANVAHQMTGTHDPQVSVSLYSYGESIGGGTSNSGWNSYAPPYNMVTAKASDLADEINDLDCPGGACDTSCPGTGARCGSCYGGTCNLTTGVCEGGIDDGLSCTGCPGGSCDAPTNTCAGGTFDGQACTRCVGGTEDGEACSRCSGGSQDGEACNPAFLLMSKFVSSTDTLLTYDGVVSAECGPTQTSGSCDFDLVPGESYRVAVTTHVNFVPDAFDFDPGDVEVYIESQRPAPCGLLDGGYVSIKNLNTSNSVRVKWHGGDPDGTNPTLFTNLVFLPDSGPTSCPAPNPNEPNNCTSLTCPGPGEDAIGCEFANCSTCGCEIVDGLQGICSGPIGSYVRCDDTTPCPSPYACVRRGDLGPGTFTSLACNQTHCSGDPMDCGFDLGVNCCDQNIDPTNPALGCIDSQVVRCTALQDLSDVDFFVQWVTIGSEQYDLPSRGMGHLEFEHVNCCEFVCTGGQHPCSASCDANNPCSSGTCVSRCDEACGGQGG